MLSRRHSRIHWKARDSHWERTMLRGSSRSGYGCPKINPVVLLDRRCRVEAEELLKEYPQLYNMNQKAQRLRLESSWNLLPLVSNTRSTTRSWEPGWGRLWRRRRRVRLASDRGVLVTTSIPMQSKVRDFWQSVSLRDLKLGNGICFKSETVLQTWIGIG